MKEFIFKLLLFVTFCLTTVTAQTSPECNGREQGKAFADTLTCHKYYFCDAKKHIYYKECPRDLHFKEDGGYCTTQADAGCTKTTSTSTTSTTSTSTTTSTSSTSSTTTKPTTLTPGPGPHPTTTPGPGPHPTPHPTPSPHTNCRYAPFGKRIPYPNDCHKFLICITEGGIVMNCPAQLHFRADLEVCDFPQRANCPWWR